MSLTTRAYYNRDTSETQDVVVKCINYEHYIPYIVQPQQLKDINKEMLKLFINIDNILN